MEVTYHAESTDASPNDGLLPGQQDHELACRLYEQGRYQEALFLLNRAILQRETSERWNDWATIQTAFSNTPLAEKAYHRALWLDPHNSQAALNLGLMLAAMQRVVEALPFLETGSARASEPQRAIAKAVRDICRASIPPTPQPSVTPPHLGGHCNVTHLDAGVLEFLIEKFSIQSMIDVGCGPGGMVHLAKRKGLRALGVDGDPQVRKLSGLNSSDLLLHDFTQGPLTIDDVFDLAWSVEFLEHVEDRFQENYMSLFQRAKYVFCTAAPPGKPGIHHVNCRTSEYWIDVFRRYGLHYDPETTESLRQVSTMQREFARETGLFFIRG